MALQSLVAVLDTEISEIRAGLATLLRGSSLTSMMDPREGYGLVIIGPDCSWDPLPSELRPLQHDLRCRAKRWFDLLSVIGRDLGSEITEHIDACRSATLAAIEQDTSRWDTDVDALARDLWRSLGDLIAMLAESHRAGSLTILVPDTNALYVAPALEKWRLPDDEPFAIVIVPAVLGELDEHKMGPTQKARTQKADRLIRQFKEYRRRGNALDGVPLLKNVSTFRMVAAEPAMERTLPWLRADVVDDRLLAAFVEISRHHLNTPAALVTADVNLQNKAAMAGVQFIEPPTI